MEDVCFFKNGSSYISAVNWDMSTKFGLLMDFYLLKAAISTNAKPEIVLSGRSRHLDKAIWRPNRSNTISGFEISNGGWDIFMAIQNGLGRGQIFFQNQQCVNILGCSVTFYKYKNVFLMLVDNVCTIQALFVTKPLHYIVSGASDMQFFTDFFWYQFVVTNRTCSIFVPLYGTRFLVLVFCADFWYVIR